MYENVRQGTEIDDLLNTCMQAEEDGTTNYPGMTYEQGIMNAIMWMAGINSDRPLGE